MKSILNFFREHGTLLLVLAGAIGFFLFGVPFAELKYGVLRVLAVTITAFGVLNLVFKSTVRPYLHSGEFAADFRKHPQRSWMTIAILALVIWVATQCFVHAGGVTDLQETRWRSVEIRKEKLHFAQALVSQIQRNRGRYEAVARETGVPWQVIASLHNMECGQSFRQNLANGDPLTSRTRHVPRGRPTAGKPPFTWEFAAVDALRFDQMHRRSWQPIGQLLQNVEIYNGTGYQRFHPDTPTPYLWSWTNHYTRGKYVADGRWDPLAVSQQCGVAPLLKLL